MHATGYVGLAVVVLKFQAGCNDWMSATDTRSGVHSDYRSTQEQTRLRYTSSS